MCKYQLHQQVEDTITAEVIALGETGKHIEQTISKMGSTSYKFDGRGLEHQHILSPRPPR